jgi:hypothetical protein
MSKTLHLYASGSDLANVVGTVGLLCELAPDSPWLQNAERSYGPDEILGSADAALAVAYPVVCKLLQSAPSIEGLPILSILEETLLEQVSYIVQTFHLDRWISSGGFSICRFASYSPWLERLRQVKAFSASTYAIIGDVPLLQANRGARAMRKLWSSRPTLGEFFKRVTPRWFRYVSAMPARKQAQEAPRGGIWFYSTAYNSTKIGLEYEAYLPGKLNFLVEDAATGGRRVRELGRECYELYAWSRASDIPSASQVRTAGNQITEAIAAAPLSNEESALRAVLLKDEWWHFFLTRWLPFAIHNSRALERWQQAVTPEMIVVGNAGDERALLMRDRRERVPAIMLQHGIMHWVYAVADQPVDVFLLRGPFFQRVINEKLRQKTVILNFPETNRAAMGASENVRADILFITAPYDVPVLFHSNDLRDILRSLLRVSHASGRSLVIRVHPMERIETYERAVDELRKELGIRANVSYSQGAGVDEVFAHSRVAVLYFSTMFVDCLRHKIPVVSFGWHWFPNKRQFEEEGIFNFASDLRHFESLLWQGIEGKLPQTRAGLEEFLAPSHPEGISNLFQEIWNTRRSANNGKLQPIP